jgi:TolB-like protein/Flp pilus assembly protein TadD/predicted Ser/Thr protein kinase
MIGKTISHYRIIEKLGEGGMGVIYKAEDTKLRRPVALKFLPPELTRDPEAKERFIQEAQAASALDHPNICNIHEIDETPEGQLFICMAYYEGETLKETIKRGPVEARETVRIAMQIGQGLAKAHSHGIVHRDIKPANIVVTDEGVVKILDFGLAKLAGQIRLTKVSSTLGTVAYMSPEQAGGKEIDRRTDIWSLGVILYEMLTGRLPFKGEYEQAIMYSILNEAPVPLAPVRPDMPKDFERILDRALAKAPENRYQHVNEMVADLESCARQLGAAGSVGATGTFGATGPVGATGSFGAASAFGPAGPAPTPARPRRPARALPYGIAAVVIIVAAIVVGRLYFTAPHEKPITSLAVLPFQNLSADPEQEYFSDGMTEALIAELSKIKALRVISRTSVMRFKKSEKSLPEIARQLNVDAVVEGSVQHVQDEVRVTAQLVRAAPEKHLWANTYTQSYRNVLALESDIAQEIAREIHVTVTPEEQERIAASRPVNPAAHEAYLKGHFHLWKYTDSEVKLAIRYLEEAIAIDSMCAPAYIDLAEAYDYLYLEMLPKEFAQKVTYYARKALSIDPTIAEAYALLGDVKLVYDWDWKGAEADYKKAIELNPNDPVAHAYYGSYLSVIGRPDEALQKGIRANELNPLDLSMRVMLANRYFYSRQYDKAEALYRAIQSMDSTYALYYVGLGRIRSVQGRFDEAVSEYRKASRFNMAYASVGLAPALARSGNTSEARTMLAQLIRQSESGRPQQVAIAATYLALGERDSSLYWLEKAYDLRDGDLPWVRIMPMFDDIRSDARYVALMKKMGLEP